MNDMRLKHLFVILCTSILTVIIILLTPKLTMNLTSDNSAPVFAEAPESDDKKGNYAQPEYIPVLMYHSIDSRPGNTLFVPVEDFTEQMRWLRDQNYHTISLDEFYEAMVFNAPLPKKSVLLTFDDGYLDNYETAWPILKDLGFKATFFIVTNSVGDGMMTWHQLQDLVKHGNSIGSHTVKHPDLKTKDIVQQEEELAVSKKVLENKLNIRINALCFPSGSYNDITLKIMRKHGYELGFTTVPGLVQFKDDKLALKRVRVSGGKPMDDFIENLFPEAYQKKRNQFKMN